MHNRPLLLDLFCGAGGAAIGYYEAGFDPVGVDFEPQPDYPFRFVHGDALRPPVRFDSFAAIHASPPCQAFTTMSNRARGDWPDLLAETRAVLARSGLPSVLENVPGARGELVGDVVTLHGGQFGLEVWRPRLFELSRWLYAPPPRAARPVAPIGFYGRPDGRRLWTRADGSELRAWRWSDRAALGMDHVADRARWHDVAEAIPPAYTRHIGEALLEQVA